MEAVDTNILDSADHTDVGSRGTFFKDGNHRCRVEEIRVWRSENDNALKSKLTATCIETDNSDMEVGKEYVWLANLDRNFGKKFPDRNRLKSLIVACVEPVYKENGEELTPDKVNEVSGEVIADAEFLYGYEVMVKVNEGETKEGKPFTYHEFGPVSAAAED